MVSKTCKVRRIIWRQVISVLIILENLRSFPVTILANQYMSLTCLLMDGFQTGVSLLGDRTLLGALMIKKSFELAMVQAIPLRLLNTLP